MGERGVGRDAAARGAHEEALLEQIGLVDVLDRVGLLAHGDRQRAEAHRARRRTSRRSRGGSRGRAGRARRRPPRAGRAPRRRRRASMWPAPRTSAKSRTRLSRRLATRGVPRERAAMRLGARGVDLHLEDARRAQDDPGEVGGLVQLEPVRDAEAVAQRRGEQAGARGGADQREGREVERDDRRARALADRDRQLCGPPSRDRRSPRARAGAGGSRRRRRRCCGSSAVR